MKTILKVETNGDWGVNGPVYRVSDEKAEELIKKGGYMYVPKSVWKKAPPEAKLVLDKP